MSTDIKIHDFHKVCRLCLSFTEIQPIFYEKYLKLIFSLTNIQVRFQLKIVTYLFVKHFFRFKKVIVFRKIFAKTAQSNLKTSYILLKFVKLLMQL